MKDESRFEVNLGGAYKGSAVRTWDRFVFNIGGRRTGPAAMGVQGITP